MTRLVRRLARVAIAALCLSLFIAAPAQGTPIVAATVTPVGFLFHYQYSITFDPLLTGEDEIALLTVNVLANDASLANLVAPPGFLLVYSSAAGQGFLDFLPVLGFPLTGTLSGFEFDSAHAPGLTTFDGLTIFGAPVSGPTTGPLGPAATVPEPASLVLVALGLGALCARRASAKGRRSRG